MVRKALSPRKIKKQQDEATALRHAAENKYTERFKKIMSGDVVRRYNDFCELKAYNDDKLDVLAKYDVEGARIEHPQNPRPAIDEMKYLKGWSPSGIMGWVPN